MKSPPKSSQYIYLLIAVFTILIIILYFLSQYKSTSPKLVPTTSITPSSSPSPSLTISEKARVIRVIDGDSIVLEDGKQVRYIGINAPEFANKFNNYQSDQCFAEEAKKSNTALVLNQEVSLVKDVRETDKYGRLLRYVYVDGELVNDFLIRWGYARLDTVPPDTQFALQLKVAQTEAQKDNRGLWDKCKSQ